MSSTFYKKNKNIFLPVSASTRSDNILYYFNNIHQYYLNNIHQIILIISINRQKE